MAGRASSKIYYPVSSSNSDPHTAYAGADWGGCQESRRSTTGILIKINGSPMYLTNKRQSLVTLSSAEAEYVARSQFAKQLINLGCLVI